jgi:hydrogenase maturation protease
LTSNETTRVCVFGCGRWLRRDDQAGLMVAEKLAQADLPEADVRATESPAADLIADLDGVGLLVVVDAAQSGPNVPAGTWRRLEYGADPGRIGARPPPVDVHQLSVDTALRLAAEMGLLPPEVWVYAAAAGDCGYGEAMTPAVEAAVSELARRIPADIEAWRRQRMGRGA